MKVSQVKHVDSWMRTMSTEVTMTEIFENMLCVWEIELQGDVFE